ncbi:MAG: hypothetical protein M3Q07_16985 [Pseudobdellovibrionaceae bacterium]|nr:hypothetical protein [Pseudobdellovibrionaceae bacterium]
MIATIHDEAGVNGAAIDAIKGCGDMPFTFDSICASHTINNASQLFKAKFLDEMDKIWNSYVSHSPATWQAYRLFVGHPCPRLTNVIRWFVKWEMWRDLLVYFKQTGDFLTDEAKKKGASDNVVKLSQLFVCPTRTLPSGQPNPTYGSQSANYRSLLFELSVVVHYGRPMCKATYYFERSKDMVLPFAEERIQLIVAHLEANDLPPKIMETIATFDGDFQSIQHWKERRNAIVAPVVGYLKKNFVFTAKPIGTKNKPRTKALRRYRVSRLFKFAELFRPDKFLVWYANLESDSRKEAKQNSNVFSDALKGMARDLSFLKPQVVTGLISQVIEMKSVAQSSTSHYKASTLWDSFWKPLEKKAAVSWWYQTAARISIIPASTADVERVVSVFTDVVGDDQANMIEETMETTVMTRYNNRTPKKRKHRRFCDDDERVSDEEGDGGED